MYGKIVVAIVLAITISKVYEANALIDDVIEVLKFGKEIGATLLETWDIVEQRTNDDGGVEVPFRKKREKKILNRLNEVTRKIAVFEEEVSVRILKYQRNALFAGLCVIHNSRVYESYMVFRRETIVISHFLCSVSLSLSFTTVAEYNNLVH